MKVYISADIEGVTGVTHWDETDIAKPENREFRKQMTAEVAAACQGAVNAGADEIWVKDAHASGRNILAAELPQEARLVRGWSGHPFMMMQELDATFDAVVMIGYHARAGADGNPLAHTLSGKVDSIRVNGRYASEFLISAYTAAYRDVPVVFASGDRGLCEEAAALNPAMATTAVKSGAGQSTVNIHPALALQQIQDGVERALKGPLEACRIALPAIFSVEVRYQHHAEATRAGYFPGATLTSPFTIEFSSENYFEVLRLLLFTA